MSYAAGALLELPDGRIALHHRDNKPYIASPDKWAFFGGMGEDGEEPLDTVVRELHEELEITLQRDRLTLIHHQMHQERSNHWLYIFHYPITTELANAVLNEGQAWHKQSPQDIPNLNIVPEHHDIITQLWHSKTRNILYLPVTPDNHILLPAHEINWEDIVSSPLARPYEQTNAVDAFQFTHHNHVKAITDIYTLPTTHKHFNAVNLSSWVHISSDTIQSNQLDFHLHAILERYWNS